MTKFFSRRIDFLFYYTTSVFQVYIGLAPLTSSALAGGATTVLCIANWTGLIYIEKMGRRTWLIGGAISQSIFLAVFTALLAHPGQETGAAAAAMIFLFIAVFGPGWAPFAVRK
jgi:ABC-type Mn2+/Zn2+ transport system permease subunit